MVGRASAQGSRGVSEDEWEAHVAAKAEQAALRQAAIASFEAEDSDFGVLKIQVSFDGEGIPQNWPEIDSDYDPLAWDFDDEPGLAKLAPSVISQIVDAIAPWVSHYRSIGLLRANNIPGRLHDGVVEDDNAPTFYLVFRLENTENSALALAGLKKVRLPIDAIAGAAIILDPWSQSFNATALYEAARQGELTVGPWGGELTPELDPAPEESRDDWLGRICIPHDRLVRLVERWRRSGGNPALFAAAGAGGGDANKDRPIEFIVPGLIPRGYVTLLAGTKQAGKSTLLGEILAVVDSECQEARFVLGTEVTARGVSCMVSGEDGMDFISSRNAYYEPVHGPGQGFVFDTAERPWAEVLELLYAIPRVDIIGIDGLRAVMPGNEDSSEAISKFFDDLNALARHHRCAIVLVHHLSKSQVRSLAAMLPAVRGSGAITDRVRVALGMIDRGAGATEIGIIKHNIPPSEALWGEINVGRLFRRDSATLSLVPIDTAARASSRGSGEAGSIECIVEAISHFNRLGVVLRQTGKRELFEQKPPQLVGLARGTIREGVTALLNLGRVSDGPEGLKTDPPLAAAEA